MNRVNNTSFMSQEALAKQLYEIDLRADCYEKGGIPLVVNKDKAYVDVSDSHTIIFGATGSKKTRMLVMPTVEILSRAGESFFVSDPKGEVYRRTARGVKSRGYEVYCLNLRDFEDGTGWNPFELPYEYYHGGNKSKAYELVGDIASVLFKSEASNDFFWSFSSVNVLTGFILLLFELGSKNECNLKNLITLWREYRVKPKEFIEIVKNEYKDTIIYTKLSSLDTTSDKTTGSIDAYVDMGMNRLAINEEFVDYLSGSSLNINELTGKKSAVYLVVPDESEYYHFVVGLFVKQFYMVLIQQAQKNQAGHIQNRMNFILDEFCNIPEIPEFSNMITAARSRNIRFHLVIQGKKQLVDKYKEKADVIMGNCSNWIYLYSREMTLLNDISQLCGEVFYDNSIKTPLISTFELQHLDKEAGEALILSGRNYPCIARLADIDEYPFETVPQYKDKKKNNAVEDEKTKLNKSSDIGIFSMNKKRAYTINTEIHRRMKRLIKEVWLVAAYKGMILAGEKCAFERDEIEYVKTKILAGNRMLHKEKKNLVWYWADVEVKEEYENILDIYPEYVFLMISELGESKFQQDTEENYAAMKSADNLFNFKL